MSSLALLAPWVSARAEWPERTFAPYEYFGAGDKFDLGKMAALTGQRYYTLAFVVADPQNRPAWDGKVWTERNAHSKEIAALRSQGGDVIVSFGGEGGKEIARVIADPAQLAAAYASVIRRYGLTWLDFDIEGKPLRDDAVNHRRNTAIATLQRSFPGLRVSYTLPVDPDGLSQHSLALLADAKAQDVAVTAVNLMTMDFGARFSKGKSLCDVSVASALQAHRQLAAIDPTLAVGLTPMIGRNDEKGEIFTLDDARRLYAWAQTQPWIRLLAFWSINRDSGKKTGKPNGVSGVAQEPWAYTHIFQGP